MDKNLENRINKLEQELKTLQSKYAAHQHNDIDGTLHLRKNIVLDADQTAIVGNAQWEYVRLYNPTDGENYITALTVGALLTRGISNRSPNMQILMTHIPNSANKFSYLTSNCAPLVTSNENTSISTTTAGNTVTISGFNFTTNELAGAYINIYNSTTLVETQQIASNTATVITIVGTWMASTTGTFIIYNPVFLGRDESMFHRLYVEEGSSVGGVRFGGGKTNGIGGVPPSQNGLLYMDAAGDLYWRDKAGTSVKLN